MSNNPNRKETPDPNNPAAPAIKPPLYRPNQHDILAYRNGKMGVSAVPGSGKTFTLSHLAAHLVERLIESGSAEEQEVLIVTFSNSAVNSFKARIAEIVEKQRGLLPYIGYRVRTLHGLAHDIVRERPALVGLSEDFQIIDDRIAASMRREAVDAVLQKSGDVFLRYIEDELLNDVKNARRLQLHDIPEVAVSIAETFIKQAKDEAIYPQTLRQRIDDYGQEMPLALFGLEVYEHYQRSLSYRGAVDFDDLVRLALSTLVREDAYRKRLQKRWPFILEDEAQDSSQSQERLLRILSGSKNWVRVGDPNQAINTTFTTANPDYLRNFLGEEGVKSYNLTEAGRSSRKIIELANTLIRWTTAYHPVEELRTAFYPQDIRMTPPGDLCPNPPDNESSIHIHYEPGMSISPEKELEMVAQSLEKWLPANPDKTVAVLVPENERGFKLAEKLRERGLGYDELLRSTTATRDAALALYHILLYLATPTDHVALAKVYRDVWWPHHMGQFHEDETLRDKIVRKLSDVKHSETYLWPAAGTNVEDVIRFRDDLDSTTYLELYDDLGKFRDVMVRWLHASILPIDQLVLTISQEIFANATDIALGYKIAQLLRSVANQNPYWRLPQFAEELRAISANERKFLGFDDAEQGFEPKTGRVTIATMHAAKGLEWDRVYLMAVSNYGFPSAQAYDKYISEKWFVRDRLNLQAEALAQLKSVVNVTPYREGRETEQARLDYAAERLRLLYVGITRARRDLIITWNIGKFAAQNGNMINQAALPLVALWEYVTGETVD